ncbi:hypothetical protein BJF78_16475 [Pseudonocardia sp. CNS-139]|nr:hypothetical protein BJF78_16475 [Pseudonocardia sp. CNS-139]
MNIMESARIALQGLRANRLRSVLTTLGVIIGVAAVIILTSLGNGVQSFVSDTLGSFTTQITVTPNVQASSGGQQPRDLTDGDAEALADRARAPTSSRSRPSSAAARCCRSSAASSTAPR